MNRRETASICDEYGIVAKKRFSQNFLCNSQFTEKIVESAGISKNDIVLEIGPGTGAMTEILCQVSAKVIAVEIDPELVSLLNNRLKEHKNLSVVSGDYLKLKQSSLLKADEYPSVIVSNLPYNVTTPMIIKLLADFPKSHTMVFMIEEDACDRLFASPGEKSYGVLSVITSSYGEKEKLFLVDSDSFFPAPHTRSAVVRFTKSLNVEPVTDAYIQFVKDSFSKRRKTLINSLSSFPRNELAVKSLPDILNEMNLSKTVRAEALPPEELITIFSILEHNK
jgi:16S rRNA (adenine1518-N6/adenine1519-N6)-dimethyltransferase